MRGNDGFGIDSEPGRRQEDRRWEHCTTSDTKTSGNRIVSFVCTQWRPLDGAFSQEPFDRFEIFVQTFKFLKKDFYENFEEELKKAGL